MQNPLASTGMLVGLNEHGQAQFLGTCFAMVRPDIFLTAAHCIQDLPLDRLSVSLFVDDVERGLSVEGLTRHPDADLAVLQVAGAAHVFDPFLSIVRVGVAGTEVQSFGFPEDSSPTGMVPVPRMFRGSVQRIFWHESHLGHEYQALELSFPAPGGLSGGPISVVDKPSNAVAGLVTENLQATMFLQKIEEEIGPDQVTVNRTHEMINYAVAVDLSAIQEWVTDEVGRFPAHPAIPKPNHKH